LFRVSKHKVKHNFIYITSWSLYTTDSLVEDLASLLDQFPQYRNVILVGHSYGSQVVVHLHARVHERVRACVLIAPAADVKETTRQRAKQITRTPNLVLDMLRRFDRSGGVKSTSVNRAVHASANLALRQKQLRWNMESRTSTLKRILYGLRTPIAQDYAALTVPALVICGEEDHVTPSRNAPILHRWLSETSTVTHPPPEIVSISGHMVMLEQPDQVNQLIARFAFAI
jgi:pimeloyl-ACP methyl ester carboxylesterase